MFAVFTLSNIVRGSGELEEWKERDMNYTFRTILNLCKQRRPYSNKSVGFLCLAMKDSLASSI